MNKLASAIKSIDAIRSKSDSAILFLSLGKDSLVLLDLLYPRFDRIVCVFMYFVKDLEHINRWIKWAKAKYPKIELEQVPHWNLSYILRGGLYCVPNPNVKLIRLSDIANSMRVKYGIDYTFLGMKKSDSMNRRLMLMGYKENYYENMGNVYPLAEWTQRDVISYMKQNRLPSPVRYSKNASGGLGLNLDCFLWLRDNFPNDLKKIYKVFPMSERILYEYDAKKQHQYKEPF